VGKDFIRLRVGVGDPDHPRRGANFVLNAPSAAHYEAIETGINAVLTDFDQIAAGDIQKAMNTINRRES
ncbi:MAG: aminoacyl-tRNA hydrolase, partial [Pseudomonadota bacterium]